jgi:CshA-type fibril repeat protein
VSGVNVPPIATNDIGSYTPGIDKVIDVLDNDKTGDMVDASSVKITSNPTGTTLASNGKTLTVPNEGEWTIDTSGKITFKSDGTFTGDPTPITYSVADAQGNIDTATVTLTPIPVIPTPVIPTPDPTPVIPTPVIPTPVIPTPEPSPITNTPLTQNDVFNIPQNVAVNLNILTNDNLIGDGIGITGIILPNGDNSLTQPHNGLIVLNNSGDNDPTNDVITYIPNANFVGVDTFQYTITDSKGNISTATVTVNTLPNLGITPIPELILPEDLVFLLQNTTTLGDIYVPHLGFINYVPEEINRPSLDITPYLYELSPLYEINYRIFNLPEKNPVGMGGQLKDQFVTDGTKTYDAGEKFTHTDNEKLSYKAMQPNGKPLPLFVTFDVDLGKFLFDAEAAKAAGVPSVLIRLIASDQQNNQASSTFQVRFDVEGSEGDSTRQTRSGTEVSAADSFDGTVYTPLEITPLRLAGVLENQFLMTGEYEYKIPKGAFEHTDPNEKLSFKATLADGSTLPNFVRFDADSNKFIFDADAAHKTDIEKIIIKVTAKDSKNNVVTVTFEVNFYELEEELEKAKLKNEATIEIEIETETQAPTEDSPEQQLDIKEVDEEAKPEGEKQNEDGVNDDDIASIEGDLSELALLLTGSFEVNADPLTDISENRAKHSLNEQVKQAGFFGYQQDKGQLLADLESVFKNSNT